MNYRSHQIQRRYDSSKNFRLFPPQQTIWDIIAELLLVLIFVFAMIFIAGAAFVGYARVARENSPAPAVSEGILHTPNTATDIARGADDATEHAANLAGELPSDYPLAGRVTDGFGYRRHPFGGTTRFHAGMDVSAPRGTRVRATADGTIIFAGRQRGYGNIVIVEHAGGYTTRYAHYAIFINLGVVSPAWQCVGRSQQTRGFTARIQAKHQSFDKKESK